MHQTLGEFTLKSGVQVRLHCVLAPDITWNEQIATLLSHKEEIWRWQIAQLLEANTGVETRFYLATLDDVPIANIMTVEVNGIGLLGHVWTVPQQRRQGVASLLMGALLSDFRNRGGRTLYLETGYDSAPYHLYSKYGFVSIEPNSGIMIYCSQPLSDFEAQYFMSGETCIKSLDWISYSIASVLLADNFLGREKSVSAPFHLESRCLSEHALLILLQNPSVGQVMILYKPHNFAVVGLAAWDWSPNQPNSHRVALICHPNFSSQQSTLLHSLELSTVY